MSDKDIIAATFTALHKLITDLITQEKFKQQFKYSVAKYINALLSDKNSQDISKLATIIDDNNDNVKEDNIQIVIKHITWHITVKIELLENLQKKKTFIVANMLNKVRKNALSFLKSSDKIVKNKAAAFKNFVKDFSTACKANNYENSFFFNDEQL
jgi:uncharacterized membrane protein YvbJ